ncbi:potassium-transporting ATPase subunit KdpC [Tumebacillus flagellatus]|nr:potassium-transporting ATPase subunit KdpC [Tumebacillus flagellatus]
MKSLFTALRASVVLMVICGLLYPLATTGVAQALFKKQAEGSLLADQNGVIGSERLAQNFEAPQFFHPRSSAAKYDPKASAATQAAVASPDYVKTMQERVQLLHQENPELHEIPADLVTTSGSGFDPDLTPEAAKAQVPRIAQATGLSANDLNSLIDRMTQSRQLGIFGEPHVNVLDLNRELMKETQ